jgi:hypothetical protein
MLAAGNEPALRAARAAADATPIVFIALDFDPVQKGYVASLSNPGSNNTGIVVSQLELAGKRVAEDLAFAARVARKMRALACLITCLTLGTMASSWWRMPSNTSCFGMLVDRFTPSAISLENRFACPTTRLVESSNLP